ncbi:hypothetical protein BDZ89DRAFT_608222 [Hymenopellis radicata]|nr:hypothetical protein BDZ89DRAFT_608222 [Hymenopellis radicata]
MILQSNTPKSTTFQGQGLASYFILSFAHNIIASSALRDAMMRVRSTGMAEVFDGHDITKDATGVTFSKGSNAFHVPLPNEAPTPQEVEVTNGGHSQAHALTPKTPGLEEAIGRVRESDTQELFMGYTIAKDANGDIIITKDEFIVRVVPRPGSPLSSTTSRTPQPLPQTVAPAALGPRSSHDLSQRNLNSTSTNGHVNSDARPSFQNQDSVPDPVMAYPPAPQISNSTLLPSVSTASSLSTTQPVPVSTNASQPVPSVESVAQPAPSVPSPPLLSLDVPPAPRSSSATSESPSRLTRPPRKKLWLMICYVPLEKNGRGKMLVQVKLTPLLTRNMRPINWLSL